MKKTQKILLVEDDVYLAKILLNRLREEGYNVDHAANGEKAIIKAKENEYALIILDLIMPKKNGYEVLEELKRVKNKVPVVVFTNLSLREDKEKAMELGAKDFKIKTNLSVDEAVSIVKSYIA